MDKTRKYFDLNREECLQRIDDESCYDLNLDELFTFVNHTHSSIGKQYLYNLLRHIPKKNKIKPYEPWLESHAKDSHLKEQLSIILKKLEHRDVYDIYPLIEQDYIPYSRNKLYALQVLQFFPTLFLGIYLISKIPLFLLLTFALFFVHAIIHYRAKTISFTYSGSMPQMYNMITAAQKLSAIAEIKLLCPGIEQSIRKVGPLKRKLSVFKLDVKLESDLAIIVWTLRELIKIFFLQDPLHLNKAFTLIRRDREELLNIFTFIGLTDTLQSIATLREVMPWYCLPRFTEEETLAAEELYHPLIRDCVPNSFTLQQHSFLVLGSNMSGKTSFVRTIGVNVLLAQTIHTAFAHQIVLAPQKILTSITIDDNLMEGQSFYLREVLRMKHILSETEEGHNLILLDELFKGTNTIERIAGAKALLEHLAANKKNIILAATHDIELIELLSNRFTPIYFTENIEEGKLSFNYKINYTRNPQKNAIRILELYGFPPEVISDALSTAEELPERFT
ncbi:hypothetical protein LJC38_04000 [Parabacteroides sp. OttesenSCG-928-K15]|nr:hypothetical protein [Parabacteroides sp. OttesenSCG-928-K15]